VEGTSSVTGISGPTGSGGVRDQEFEAKQDCASEAGAESGDRRGRIPVAGKPTAELDQCEHRSNGDDRNACKLECPANGVGDFGGERIHAGKLMRMFDVVAHNRDPVVLALLPH
jgi:hypothetical protein